MSRDSCVALSHDVTGLSAVCDCGISCSYSLTIFNDGIFVILTILIITTLKKKPLISR